MADNRRNLPHFLLKDHGKTEPYTTPRNVFSKPPPFRERRRHAAMLRGMLNSAIQEGRALRAEQAEVGAFGEVGLYLEIQMLADDAAAIDRLEKRQGKADKHIELLSVKEIEGDDGQRVLATVFVPEASIDHYLNKINQYQKESTINGNPKNAPLVARMEEIKLASVRSLFTDDIRLFPKKDREIWWEAWIRDGHQDQFFEAVEHFDLSIKDHDLSFPERKIVLIRARPSDLGSLLAVTDAVAEFRLSKDEPSVFLEMRQDEREEWAADLVNRIEAPPDDAVSICLLDTGANSSHPLLKSFVPLQLSCDVGWGVHDHDGHGTAMAGIAIYGNIYEALISSEKKKISHYLESVKIMPPKNDTDPRLYGWITTEAVGRVEIEAAERKRIFCMAVTSSKALMRGRPSSWSSQIDKLCSGADDAVKRLMIISAGNIRDDIHSDMYIDINDTSEIENPAQSWNALTVGSYTEKTIFVDEDYDDWEVVAGAGNLSPSCRTSVSWQRQWPIKPEVLFEGGNRIHPPGGGNTEDHADLCLLTTNRAFQIRMFRSFGETSGASALAANFAAQILRAQPELKLETVRALIVHSANWTNSMKRQFDAVSQSSRMVFLRRYGYGVPDLERALNSAKNDATLIVESSIQPFVKRKEGVKTKDMRFHRLPWPKETLLDLGETPVELKVTLSYFIEPSPGERGWTRRYAYASHGLRFDVQRPLETYSEFRQRLNRQAEDEENAPINRGSAESPGWYLGSLRDRGSVHSDIWYGKAADLARRSAIGIYPVGGWWRERVSQGKYDKVAEYSLIISLSVPRVDVDIYSEILIAIENVTEIEIDDE